MISKDFLLIKQDLELLQLDPAATIRYDLMSDALVWSDEIPRGRRVNELWCMRPVLRYRTGLILGLEIVEFEEVWRTAKTIFPLWIGFIRDRTEPNIALQQEYRKRSGK